MPRKSDGTFNQAKYQAEWRKKNMKSVVGNYKADFVEEFKQACATLGVKQSDLIREMMIATIEKAKQSK